ncbi:helix-turn-helix transcriptional regulator [Fulvivirga ulvae]|uniref:helix-turn-helix transcriptional regulator n=1 Tax=Fulvivirga ulvae TaxID=2904245 RepID=UPI001F475AB7|nr:helix-turn-helix transcriptional regulator [Fulvivirga ulvae]UII31485.1 helix-turn-helix transcriptional regulator [Fulvivirga ulvae]
MRFDKVIPTDRLKPYIRYFVISENAERQTYKVFPSTSLVIGFQYKGRLSTWSGGEEANLASAGITGISGSFKLFTNTANIGTILICFTETGLAQFTSCPAHELFNQSISLDHLFESSKITETEEKLSLATTDVQRISVIEHFLLSQFREKHTDKLIVKAIDLIYQSKGTIRIKTLNDALHISQSPFEKRFRKLVGTSPKKFTSIVRFQSVLRDLEANKGLTETCYENNFFDQAHFIKSFKQFTGQTPEQFRHPS